MSDRISGRLGRQREPEPAGQDFQTKVTNLLVFIAGRNGQPCSARHAISASSKATFAHALKQGLIVKVGSGRLVSQATYQLTDRDRHRVSSLKSGAAVPV